METKYKFVLFEIILIFCLCGCSNEKKVIIKDKYSTFEGETYFFITQKKDKYFWFNGNDLDLYGNDYDAWEEDFKVKKIDINIPDSTRNKSELIVAILDDGIDLSIINEDNIWYNKKEIPNNGKDDDNNGFVDDINGYNFVDNNAIIESESNGYHGNYVSSILAGKLDKFDYKGLLNEYNVKFVFLKVVDDFDSTGKISYLNEAIKYAESVGAKICNMSLCWYRDDKNLRKSIDESSMLFIAPAGNDGCNIDENNKVFPAYYRFENVITVADLRADGKISYTSNYSDLYVDVMAPGTDIVGIYDKDKLISLSGTSSATVVLTAEIINLYLDEMVDVMHMKEYLYDNVSKSNYLSTKCSSKGYYKFN